MRLSEILSKKPSKQYVQIDGFLQNKKGSIGQSVKISIGQIALNYYCQDCEDLRTFFSKGNLEAIFVNRNLISIDSVLTCAGCGKGIPVWFLVESNNDITGQAPEVRILKKTEKNIQIEETNNYHYNKYIELLNKAEQAFNENLGSGSIVYLRKVFEKITVDSANAINIEYDKYENGNPKNFSQLLKMVDEKSSIIPREFSSNGYKLFRELSNIVHGDCDEAEGINKFEPLYRLVVGIVENVKNHKEIMDSIEKLQWNISGGEKNV